MEAKSLKETLELIDLLEDKITIVKGYLTLNEETNNKVDYSLILKKEFIELERLIKEVMHDLYLKSI